MQKIHSEGRSGEVVPEAPSIGRRPPWRTASKTRFLTMLGIPSIMAKSKVGLDIGTHSIKVVEVQERHGKRVLRNLGIKEIPIIYRGKDNRDITAIARLVRELFTETGIANKGVVLATSGSGVSIKVVKVPQMPKSELKEAIKWEMRSYVQFPVEDAILDYSVLGTVMENGATKIKLLVVVAQKDAIYEQLAIIKAAGLSPAGIDATPFAMWRPFEGTKRPSDGETIALIDIGYRRTSISLVTDNAIQFTRDAKIGGNNLTEALLAPMIVDNERVSLEYDEAERLKCRYGVPPRDSLENAEEGIPLSQIYLILRPVLEKLLVETGRSFDFFASQLHVEKIDKIILSGGGAMVKGLPELLSQGLNIDVEVASPFKDISSDVKDVDDVWLHEMSPNLATAMGLALTVPGHIDLIPQKIKIRRQKVVQGTVFATSSFVLLLILTALYWNASKNLSALQRELSTKRSQLSATVTPATKLPQLKELREKVRREKTLLPKESFKRYSWTEIMKEISNTVPPKAMLTSLSVETEMPDVLHVEVGETTEKPAMQGRKLMRLNGIIFDKEPDDRIELNRFIRFLEVSPIFTNISLVSTQNTTEYEQAGKSFEFVCIPDFERKK